MHLGPECRRTASHSYHRRAACGRRLALSQEAVLTAACSGPSVQVVVFRFTTTHQFEHRPLYSRCIHSYIARSSGCEPFVVPPRRTLSLPPPAVALAPVACIAWLLGWTGRCSVHFARVAQVALTFATRLLVQSRGEPTGLATVGQASQIAPVDDPCPSAHPVHLPSSLRLH